jgi:hypothetical protein
VLLSRSLQHIQIVPACVDRSAGAAEPFKSSQQPYTQTFTMFPRICFGEQYEEKTAGCNWAWWWLCEVWLPAWDSPSPLARASKSRNVDTTRPDASVPCMPYPSICAKNISAVYQNHIGTSVLNTTFGKLARTFQMLAWYQDSGSQRASVTGKNLPGKHGEISLVMYSMSTDIHHLFLRTGRCGPWEALQMRWRMMYYELWSLPPCDASASPLQAH